MSRPDFTAMQDTPFDTGVELALDSILNDRLALLCGAGLSMAPPSSLPAATVLAAAAKRKYEARYGMTRTVEAQAEFFFQRHELHTVYFRSLIDFNAFAGPPNPGHYPTTDLLLVRGIQTVVTTNVDFLIEAAGQTLLGQVGAGIDSEPISARIEQANSGLGRAC